MLQLRSSLVSESIKFGTNMRLSVQDKIHFIELDPGLQINQKYSGLGWIWDNPIYLIDIKHWGAYRSNLTYFEWLENFTKIKHFA